MVVDDHSSKPFDTSTYEGTIKYIRNEENLGPGESRNVGLTHASGDYVVFLDCDDYWDASFLEKMVGALQGNDDTIMAYCNGYNVDSEKGHIEKREVNPHINSRVILPDILIYTRHWVTGGCLWDMGKIGNTKWLNTRVWEDYAFDISQALTCNKVLKVEDYLIYYETSGDDKLSLRDQKESIVDKNASLIFIAQSIRVSSFFENHRIRRRLVWLLLNNSIDLLRLGMTQQNGQQENIRTIRQYQDRSLSLLIWFCLKLPTRLSLPLLRKKRKHFKF